MDLIVMNHCRPLCSLQSSTSAFAAFPLRGFILLTSLHLSCSYCHTVLPDRWYCRALKLCNTPWRYGTPWNISSAVARLAFCWKTAGCGFSGCACWEGRLFGETFFPSVIKKNAIRYLGWHVLAHCPVSLVTSIWTFWFFARRMSLWATTNQFVWTISNRKQHDANKQTRGDILTGRL